MIIIRKRQKEFGFIYHAREKVANKLIKYARNQEARKLKAEEYRD